MNERSNAALFGKGVFTTIRIIDRRPFLWHKHWGRLIENATKIGIDLVEHSETSVRASLDESVAWSNLIEGRARITFLDDSPSDLWPSGRSKYTTLSIIVGTTRPLPKPFNLTMSPYPVNSRSPLAAVKSCNYLENLIAADEARQRGSHEAVRLNERGLVTSGCMANVFWLKDGLLFTPALSTGCLPGTTREFVLENLDCEEVETGIDAIEGGDAIFLTSAGLGVVAVDELGSRGLSESSHPILELLPNRA